MGANITKKKRTMFYCPLFRIIYGNSDSINQTIVFSQIFGDSFGALILAVISSGLYSHLLNQVLLKLHLSGTCNVGYLVSGSTRSPPLYKLLKRTIHQINPLLHMNLIQSFFLGPMRCQSSGKASVTYQLSISDSATP